MTEHTPPDGGCQHMYRMDRCGDTIEYLVTVNHDGVFEDHEPAINGELWLCKEHFVNLELPDDEPITMTPINPEKHE